MITALSHLRTLLRMRLNLDERGQDLLEYALIGGFVALAIVLGGVLLSGSVTDMFTEIGECIDMDGGTVCDAGP